jgi:hypothetical protein
LARLRGDALDLSLPQTVERDLTQDRSRSFRRLEDPQIARPVATGQVADIPAVNQNLCPPAASLRLQMDEGSRRGIGFELDAFGDPCLVVRKI